MSFRWIRDAACWLRLDALSLGWAEVSLVRGHFKNFNGACERDGMKEICVNCGRTRVVGFGSWRMVK